MTMFRYTACAVMATFGLIVMGLPAAALELHTFVSALNGTDTNATTNLCRRTIPCRSISVAIALTQAGGTVTMLDDGMYDSNFVVDKHLTIEGQGAGSRIYNQGQTGVVTHANFRVVLRNFAIDGGLDSPGRVGIFVDRGAAVTIQNVTISNQLFNQAAGILISGAASNELHMENVSISNSGLGTVGGAVVVDEGAATGVSHKIHIERTTIEHNWRGIVLKGNANTSLSIANSAITNTMGSSAINIQPSGGTQKIEISDTTISNSTGDGISINPSGGTTNLDIQNSKAVNSTGTGLLIAPTGSARVNTTVSGSAMSGNLIGIRSFPGGSAVSNVTISDTSASNNAGGIHASGKSVVSIIRGSIGGNSSYGVGAVSPAAVRIGSSVVNGNTLGFSGPISSYGNNQLHGNTNPGSSTPLPPGSMP